MEILIEDKIIALIESQYSLAGEEIRNNTHNSDSCNACKLRRDFDQLDDLMKIVYMNFFQDVMEEKHPIIIKFCLLTGFQLAMDYRDILDMEKAGLITNNEVKED